MVERDPVAGYLGSRHTGFQTSTDNSVPGVGMELVAQFDPALGFLVSFFGCSTSMKLRALAVRTIPPSVVGVSRGQASGGRIWSETGGS